MNHTRATLIDALHKRGAFTKADAETALDVLLTYIAGISEGDKIELREFGTFSRRRISTTSKRNPRTGKTVDATSFTTVRFKPSKFLRWA